MRESAGANADPIWASLPPPTKATTAYRMIRSELWHFRIRNAHDLTGQRLAGRLGVSRNTISRALDRLAGERMLRRVSHGRHAPYVPSGQEVAAAYSANLALAEATYRPDALLVRRHHRRDRERAERLAHAERLVETQDPDLAASEVELLLRKIARYSGGPIAARAIERDLAVLARIRRVEQLVLPDYFDEVAQLMRYFYAGRYPKLVRSLEAYTRQRVSAANVLALTLRASQEEV
jgi:DNA-binding GntR family transcriptional regulator